MANQNPLLKSESSWLLFLTLNLSNLIFFTAATTVLY